MNDDEGRCRVLALAAGCYVDAGKHDSSCRVWLKVAEIRETSLQDFVGAADGYCQYIELSLMEEKQRNAVDAYKLYTGFLARRLLASDDSLSSMLYDALDQQASLQLKLKQVGIVE